MPAPTTAADLLELVRKSGVVDDARLQAAVDALVPPPADALTMARQLIEAGLLTFFQSEQLLAGKWKRFFIGKYKVLERLGSGGMGQVFLCEHKVMRRRVAVKVLPAAKAADPASLERFYREARAVAAVDHPNLVRAYDIDQDDHLHFLVMEHVDGTNLHDLVQQFGPLAPVRAAQYVRQAAVGLHHAHQMGLVHRDIKPANVLVDRFGTVKILDMGLARFFHDQADQLTRKYDESVLGTADFLAPEQALDSHLVDIRADLYALGGTLYFLLCGKPPFPDGTVAQKLLFHQTRDPQPLGELVPAVPPELTAVVARLMKKEPADRFQTPADLADALAPWADIALPPPADNELPRLSPAATAATGLASQAHSRSSLSFRPAVPLPPAAASLPAAGPLLGAPLTASAAAAVAPAEVWADLGTETQPVSKADTVPPTPRSVTLVVARRRPWLLIAAGLVVLAGVAGAVAWFLLRPPPAPPVVYAPGPPEPKTWTVSRAGAGGALPTLRRAVEAAGPGDTVRILDDRLDEPPVAVGKGKRGVRVEAGSPNKRVAWVPAGSVAVALDLAGVDGFAVSGLDIDLGGKGLCGVNVAGGCPGLRLDDVTVRGAKEAGVRLRGVTGTADRPVTLNGVRVVASGRTAVGVELVGGCRDVMLDGCRLEGPGDDGVRVVGPAAGVSVRQARVWRFDCGLRLAGQVLFNAPFGLLLDRATVCDARAGVGCGPPLGADQSLAVTGCFFARVKELAVGPADGVPGLVATNNARDTASAEGKLPLSARVVPHKPATGADDPAFLRGPAGVGFGD